MSVERTSKIINFDIPLLLTVACLITLSILFIYSSAISSAGILTNDEFLKQLAWGIFAIIILLIFSYVNYNLLKEFSLWLFIFFAILLILTLLFGKVVNGAKAWLGFWGLGGQPSEFTKIMTILFLSKFLSENQISIKKLSTFVKAFLILLIPMVLILRQPDTGTTLVFIPIFLMLIFMAGGRLRHIGYIVLTGIVSILFTLIPFVLTLINKERSGITDFFSNPLIQVVVTLSFLAITIVAFLGWKKFKSPVFYWMSYFISIVVVSLVLSFILRHIMKEYQIMRFIVFLDPQIDPKGSGWNLIQSMTAIGSGGFNGKGFLQGTQSHYHFLPMQSTDFIFSIIGEELGFVGVFLIFSLYGILIGRMLFMMLKIQDTYGVLVISGFIAVFITHIFVNIGMVAGMMPITGIPLYFISYGGSSLVAACLSVGIVMNIYSRRFNF